MAEICKGQRGGGPLGQYIQSRVFMGQLFLLLWTRIEGVNDQVPFMNPTPVFLGVA